MRFGGVSFVVAVVIATATESIRVYEGTNFARPDNSTWNAAGMRRAESRSDRPRAPDQGNQLLKFSKELKPTPTLYKVKLTQQGYLQFLRYLTDIPPLREYTFCLWFMGTNLTHAQPLFSYAVQDKQRLLALWYEPKDATIRKSIRDDLAFKVPALIAENHWHHICESWNGVLGEWALFFDGSKIGSGRLHKYKGTYVPGGGEVVVGQEPTDFHKGLDDGIEGELFGFNLVDEAVPDDVVIRKNRMPDAAPEPAVPTGYVPPFKSLPPMKKSYQEIKAFIKSLPSGPSHYGLRNGPKPKPGVRPPVKPHHKAKGPKHPQRPRNKHRPPYKPVKAIVYEREDRQMRLEEPKLTKKLGQLPPENTPPKVNQVYNENYSIHSYRIPKERPKTVATYEIYEVPDDDVDQDAKKGQRKARMNFNIYAARQTNNLYAKMRKARQHKKPIFHFEVNAGKAAGIRRSLKVDEPVTSKSVLRPKTPLEFIPVYEAIEDDLPLFRRKRDIAEEDELTRNFRPMPKMPDGFISIFANVREKTEMDQKLSRFFPNRTEQATRGPPPAASSTLSPITEKFLPVTPETEKLAMRNDVFDSPSRVLIRRNMIVTAKELERRPGLTAGAELVKRSYEECVSDRGSPVKDKDRLVISWADTPVRIYGGAVVTTAFNICGHF